MIVENRIVRNFRCVLLATFGIMSVMLFIWCFDSTLAPYTMNSFFSRFSKLSEVLILKSFAFIQASTSTAGSCESTYCNS